MVNMPNDPTTTTTTTTTTRVEPIAREEFDSWLTAARGRMVARVVDSRSATSDEAARRVDAMCKRVIPDGFDSDENAFLVIRSGDAVAGSVWFALDGDDVFVRDIAIADPGLENSAAALVEDYARTLGQSAIKWFVYGHDAATIRLLDRENYRPASATMRMDLADRHLGDDTGIVLRPMTQERFDTFMATSITEFAGDLFQSGSNPTEESALEESERQFHELLPDGLHSENDHLWSAYAPDASDTAVGMLWIEVAPSAGELRGFVYDLAVDEEFRRRGYGRAIMLEGERQSIALGAVAIGLNVFGFNAGARKLYDDLGYQVVDEVLRRDL